MKKIFIIFLFTTFGFTLTFAEDNKKITVEEIEDIFFKFYDRDEQNEIYYKWKEKSEKESYKKRVYLRGIAKCKYMWEVGGVYAGPDQAKRCDAKIIRVVMTGSERAKKKRPGDLFYALSAIENLIYEQKKRDRFIKTFQIDVTVTSGNYESKKRPGMRCSEAYRGRILCKAFKKSTYKKIEQFKKDPSNEKVLGNALIKYIKSIKMIQDIREKVGTENYELLGDMLNDVVIDVKKNKVSLDLKKRRVLLKRYSLNLGNIKKKLDEEKYKSIDKDISNLSKTFKTLKTLAKTSNKLVINIDEAVNIIFDTNKLVQSLVLNAKKNEEQKLLAVASINVMQSLIDSILNVIPEKFTIETKKLSPDLFEEYDLVELEGIINSLIENRIINSKKLTKDMDMINKYINSFEVVNKLDNLGIKNKISKDVTINKVVKIVNKHVNDNLNKEVFKDVRKFVQDMNNDNSLSELTKEVSKEVSNVSEEVSKKISNTPTYNSVLEHKIGGQSLGRLIAASRR